MKVCRYNQFYKCKYNQNQSERFLLSNTKHYQTTVWHCY